MTTIEEAFEKYWSSLADAPNDSPQVVASCKWAAYHAWHAAIEQYTAERVAEATAEWNKLRDPVTLHVSLLRGFPAQLDRATFLHIAGDEPPNAQVTGAAPTNGERSDDL